MLAANKPEVKLFPQGDSNVIDQGKLNNKGWALAINVAVPKLKKKTTSQDDHNFCGDFRYDNVSILVYSSL